MYRKAEPRLAYPEERYIIQMQLIGEVGRGGSRKASAWIADEHLDFLERRRDRPSPFSTHLGRPVMGHAALRGAVEAYLVGAWSSTPIAFDNVEFTPPADGRYLSLSVSAEHSEVIGLGHPPLYRHKGAIKIRCYVPKGVGSAEVLSMADEIAVLFRHRTIGGARTRAAVVSLTGASFDDFEATVTIPFWWDES